jgi:hypothetical protein
MYAKIKPIGMMAAPVSGIHVKKSAVGELMIDITRAVASDEIITGVARNWDLAEAFIFQHKVKCAPIGAIEAVLK